MIKKPTYEELEQRVKELEKKESESKQTEVRLEASEKRSRAWLEHSPICTKIVDLDFNLRYMSSAGIKKLKINDITECYRKPYPLEFYPEPFRSDLSNNFEKVKETGEIITMETAVLDMDGNELWYDATLVPVNDEEGRIDYIIIVSVETTERKKAEETLLESEAKYRKLLELSPDPIAIIQNNRHAFINQAHTELFGYTVQDVDKGLSQLQLAPEKDHERVLSRMSERFAGEEPIPKVIGTDIVTKEGKIIPCEITGRLIEYDGQPADLTIIRDITERKRAEEALRESEERFRSLVEVTSDWIWEVDQNGIFTYADPKVKDFLGYEPEEVVGKPYNYFMNEDSSKMLASSFKDQAEKPRHFSRRNNTQIHKDGRQIMIETSGLPICDIDGKVVGWRGISTDITERKQAEAERERLIGKLQEALDNIKTLRGLVPICAECKKIRDDKGYWNQIEGYIERHSEALFSHALCPECMNTLYGDTDWYKKGNFDK